MYWNATRAFMILSSLSATSGIIMGILAFAQQPTFTRVSRPFSAGIMFFASSEWTHPSPTLSPLPATPKPNPALLPTPFFSLTPPHSQLCSHPNSNPSPSTNSKTISNSTSSNTAVQFWHNLLELASDPTGFRIGLPKRPPLLQLQVESPGHLHF